MREYAGTLLLLMALAAPACSPEGPEDVRTRHWSKGTAAPAEFKFWIEDDVAISLPAGKAAFLEYVGSRGGRYYIFGEGTYEVLPIPPSPYPESPCSETVDAIDVFFDSPNHSENPHFVAYVSDAKVVCVDPQFGYAIPGFW